MINPFDKIKIELDLSLTDISILISCLRNSIPKSRTEEHVVINLENQLVRKLEELNNGST